MIETITIPTARLASGSRLLLDTARGYHAFTEAQLVDAVRHANQSMTGVIRALGRPTAPSPMKGTEIYGRPNHNPGQLEQFLKAYEWLAYQGLAGVGFNGNVWVKA